jgi:hypothetical protein
MDLGWSTVGFSWSSWNWVGIRLAAPSLGFSEHGCL